MNELEIKFINVLGQTDPNLSPKEVINTLKKAMCRWFQFDECHFAPEKTNQLILSNNELYERRN